jgi:hypothetical protein
LAQRVREAKGMLRAGLEVVVGRPSSLEEQESREQELREQELEGVVDQAERRRIRNKYDTRKYRERIRAGKSTSFDFDGMSGGEDCREEGCWGLEDAEGESE